MSHLLPKNVSAWSPAGAIKTYMAASTVHSLSERPADKPLPLCNNTTMKAHGLRTHTNVPGDKGSLPDNVPDDDLAYTIRLHDTNIVSHLRCGATLLNTGGFHTATTRDRMNRFSRFRVHSVNHVLHVTVDGEKYDLREPLMIVPTNRYEGRKYEVFERNRRINKWSPVTKIDPEHTGKHMSFEALMQEG